jgi:copper chaperone CopZ
MFKHFDREVCVVQREFFIEGMSCQHCVLAVKQQLARIPSLVIKEVKIGAVSVVFDESKTTDAKIEEAIVEAGYSLVR